MKFPGLVLAISLALSPAAHARMGDSPVETDARYGPPVTSTGKQGELTSTRTYSVSGLQVTCGYVDGKVEAETYARDDRDFNPQEVEAILRTNGTKRLGWTTPAGGYVNGTYNRIDGATATLTGTKLAIQSPKWADALARDQATEKADAAKAASSAATSGANPNYTTGAATNAASYPGAPTETNLSPQVTPTTHVP